MSAQLGPIASFLSVALLAGLLPAQEKPKNVDELRKENAALRSQVKTLRAQLDAKTAKAKKKVPRSGQKVEGFVWEVGVKTDVGVRSNVVFSKRKGLEQVQQPIQVIIRGNHVTRDRRVRAALQQLLSRLIVSSVDYRKSVERLRSATQSLTTISDPSKARKLADEIERALLDVRRELWKLEQAEKKRAKDPNKKKDKQPDSSVVLVDVPVPRLTRDGGLRSRTSSSRLTERHPMTQSSTMKHRTIAGLASALLLIGVLSSQDKENKKNKQDTSINETCIITGKAIPVDAPTSEVRGAVLAFCCKKCKAKYDAKPRQYTDKVRALMTGSRGRQASGRGRTDYGSSGGNKIADPAQHTKAMAKPVFSGPQKGEKLRSFKVTGLRGDHKGKEYDPVARAGDDMQLLLFTKGSSGGRIVPLLSHQLGAIMKGSGKTWRASVVHLSDDPNEISKYAAKFQGRVGGFFDMGIAKDGAAGPGSYGLDRTVTHTFLFAKNGKVVHNLVFTQQVFFNEPHLLGAIADVMGVDHKTLGKWLDSNMKRTAGRGGARRTFTPEQKAFRKQLGERLQKGEITREEAGRLYRAKFPNDPGIKRRKDGKKTP